MPLPLASFARTGAAILLAASAFMATVHAAEALPTIDSFFASARFSHPQLAPNGKLLAVVTGTNGKRDELTVLDLVDGRVHVTASFRDADIGQFQWVNDKRLVFSTRDKQLASGQLRGGPGGELHSARRPAHSWPVDAAARGQARRPAAGGTGARRALRAR